MLKNYQEDFFQSVDGVEASHNTHRVRVFVLASAVEGISLHLSPDLAYADTIYALVR